MASWSSRLDRLKRSVDEVMALRKLTADLSLDAVNSPGFAFDPASAKGILDQYRASIFRDIAAESSAGDAPAPVDNGTSDLRPFADVSVPADGTGTAVPSTVLARLIWLSFSAKI